MVSDSDHFDDASASGEDWLRDLLESESLGTPISGEAPSADSPFTELFADANMTEVMRRLFEVIRLDCCRSLLRKSKRAPT